MSIGQKEAVVSAVAKILGKNFEAESTDVKEIITTEQLSQLRETILKGIQSGDIAYNKDTSDEKAIRRYVNGMIDNHFRKAKELNGGQKYSVSTNSSGRGVRDPQLSALRKLAKNYESGSFDQQKVLTAISGRESQLIAERQQAATLRKREATLKNIDTSVLSPELVDILNNK